VRLRRLTRSPAGYWLAVAVLAAVTGVSVARVVTDATEARARLGAFRTVAVATAALEAGHVVTRSDLVLRTMPGAFVPRGAIGSAVAVTGRTVVVPVFPGEAVLDVHLAPAGVSGVAALLPPGRVAIAIPAGAATPAVRAGDRLDVLASVEGRETVAVAKAATAVDVGAEAVTVAVTPDEARQIADAVTRGALTLVVRSPIGNR
jgi:Flp pilus assembly protein CpaB